MARRRRKQAFKRRRHRRDPLIGYFAARGLIVVCDGDGCIIAGSMAKMTRILEHHRQDVPSYRIQATTFSEICRGIELGGAYCFDEEAYGRFLAPAQAAGWPLAEEDFSDPGPTGIHLVRIGFV